MDVIRIFSCAGVGIVLVLIQVWSLRCIQNGWRWSGGILYGLTIIGLLTDLGTVGFGSVSGFWIWLY